MEVEESVCDKSVQVDDCNMQYVLDCGHPCVMCMHRDNIPISALNKDHCYSSVYYSVVNDTAEPSVKISSAKPVDTCSEQDSQQQLQVNDLSCFVGTSSTPIKKVSIPLSSNLETVNMENDDLLDLSVVSNTYRDDSKDQTFELPSDLESEAESLCSADGCNYIDSVEDKKFIVFNSCLQDLFVRLKCAECDSAVDPDDIQRDESDGTLIRCSVYCSSGHLIIRWASQPIFGKMPAGNLLACAATLFSGQTYSHISQFASFLNLKFVSHTTYDKIQRQNLMPVIMHTWSTFQNEILKQVKDSGRMLRLAGDGRCDSPGYSAKYCTYSLLDMDSDTVVTFVVIQVNETGSSCRMEVEGFRRCMNYLLELGFTIEVLATDRHVQIRSVMNKEFSNINHQFDVWHLANNLKKKLTQRAKSKGAEELSPWIKAICNHLWWCARNCNGDKVWLEETWKSVVFHVANEHEFSGDLITRCTHEPLDPEVARKKKWLQKGSKAHNALKEVVLDKRLVKDIRQLSEFCHTGSLEVYHSLMTKYVPKRQEFDFDQMVARTALAVIDHNMSRNRLQATNKKGEKQFRLVCPKATSEWVVKPVYEAKSYDWVYAMLKKVVSEKECRTLSPVQVSRKGNIARTPAPLKSDVILKLSSRFK